MKADLVNKGLSLIFVRFYLLLKTYTQETLFSEILNLTT